MYYNTSMKRKVGIAIIMLISIGVIWAPKAFADIPPPECISNRSSQECYNVINKDKVINNICIPSSGCLEQYGVLKQSWFYVNLLLTLIIELIIVLLLIRPISRRKVMTVILVNIASYVPFIILLTIIVNYLDPKGIRDIYWPIVAIGEVGVIIFEALIFKKVLKLNIKKAFAVSIIANTMSAVVGYFISVVLLR